MTSDSAKRQHSIAGVTCHPVSCGDMFSSRLCPSPHTDCPLRPLRHLSSLLMQATRSSGGPGAKVAKVAKVANAASATFGAPNMHLGNWGPWKILSMDEICSHHFETWDTIVAWLFQGNHQGGFGGAGFVPDTECRAQQIAGSFASCE